MKKIRPALSAVLALIASLFISPPIFAEGALDLPIRSHIEVLGCQNLSQINTRDMRRCQLIVPSPSALRANIYVIAWLPTEIKPETEVIVFLHGREYTRLPEEKASMLEHMDIETYLTSSAYQTRPHIILAPQDNFTQSDSQQRGQDYWVGSEGRHWGEFLSFELPAQINELYKLNRQTWKSIGVSMGAHGAMKLAMDYPQSYRAFAAISPVFRSTLEEIPQNDRDVFVTETRVDSSVIKKIIVNNVGHQVLGAAQQARELQLPPHFIKVHRYDSLSLEQPSAKTIWRKLRESSNTTDSFVSISDEEGFEPGQGHSMRYWKIVLPQAMNWLITE